MLHLPSRRPIVYKHVAVCWPLLHVGNKPVHHVVPCSQVLLVLPIFLPNLHLLHILCVPTPVSCLILPSPWLRLDGVHACCSCKGICSFRTEPSMILPVLACAQMAWQPCRSHPLCSWLPWSQAFSTASGDIAVLTLSCLHALAPLCAEIVLVLPRTGISFRASCCPGRRCHGGGVGICT